MSLRQVTGRMASRLGAAAAAPVAAAGSAAKDAITSAFDPRALFAQALNETGLGGVFGVLKNSYSSIEKSLSKNIESLDMMQETNEEVRDLAQTQVLTLGLILKNLRDRFKWEKDIEARDAFADQEENREKRKNKIIKPDKKEKGGFFDFMKRFATFGLLIPALIETTKALTDIPLDAVARLRTLPKHLMNAVKSIDLFLTQGMKNFFKGVAEVWKKAGTGQFLTQKTLLAVRPFITIIDKVGSAVKSAMKVMDPITRVLGSMVKFVKSTVSPFIGAVRGVGKFIFGPITLAILSLIDFVQDFVKSYNADGNITKAIYSGLKGVFKGIITEPLDLLKNVAAWITDKLGFENFANVMREFSFTELFNDTMTSIENIVLRGWQMATSAISDLSEWNPQKLKNNIEYLTLKLRNHIADMISDVFQKVEKFINPKVIMKSVQEVIEDSKRILKAAADYIGGIVDVNAVRRGIAETIEEATLFFKDPGGWVWANYLKPIVTFFSPSQSQIDAGIRNMKHSGMAMLLTPGVWFTQNIVEPLYNIMKDNLPDASRIKQLWNEFDFLKILENLTVDLQKAIEDGLSGIVKSTTDWFSDWFKSEEKKIQKKPLSQSDSFIGKIRQSPKSLEALKSMPVHPLAQSVDNYNFNIINPGGGSGSGGMSGGNIRTPTHPGPSGFDSLSRHGGAR